MKFKLLNRATQVLTFSLGMFITHLQANQQIQQEVLDGSIIPKFVEPLPTFNGKRADGTKKLTVIAKEFQQKILPRKFYEKLAPSVTYKSVETGEPLFTINPNKVQTKP